MATMLEVKDLSKKFKDAEAVKNLSFTVEEGDIYGFLGENGAGKSTTLRMLLKLVKPTGGEIIYRGKNIQNDHNEMLRQTGAVIEKPDLYKYLSAYDNLSIFARLSGMKPQRSILMEQLDMVGLASRAHSKIKTFSQGMKQRMGIAVALVHSPELIILDEPTNGLDPQGIADMRHLILRLGKELRKTVIISSHLLSEIEMVANRMIIIHKGEKKIEGNVAELLDPSNTLVELQTTNNASSFLKLQQSKWAKDMEDRGDAIRLRMSREEIPLLAASLNEMNIGILSLRPRHSLEDYFLSLTNQDAHVEPSAN